MKTLLLTSHKNMIHQVAISPSRLTEMQLTWLISPLLSINNYSDQQRSNWNEPIPLLGTKRWMGLDCYPGDCRVRQTEATKCRLCQLCHKVSTKCFLFRFGRKKFAKQMCQSLSTLLFDLFSFYQSNFGVCFQAIKRYLGAWKAITSSCSP